MGYNMPSIEEIKNAVASIAMNYEVKSVRLFGSYADGEQSEKSDIDLLVEFHTTPVCLFTIFDMKKDLRKKLKRKVDIVRVPLSPKSYVKVNKEIPIYAA